ncbi:hypothetical protein [Roseimarinus sediminis]|jgi:hypothetical protein|uniref:hypothetical protein n=1 Tax=Roseimarinus sediminis TaxID=1610899 RepID=UPI003D24D3B1
MKGLWKIVIILLIVFCFYKSKAQQLSLAYNSTFSGRNCALTFIKDIGRSEIGAGIRYNINMWSHPDDQQKMFYKRQYATEPLHHLGLQTYFHQYVWSVLYVFYDLQLSYSETFNRMYFSVMYDPKAEEPYTREDILYHKVEEYFGPFIWVEQYIGFGVRFEITESILLSQKIGLGICHLIGSDDQLPQTWNRTEYGFGHTISIGLSYKFW